jgi:bacteriocin biosynthesis cyclodehydratase domain-containing protein
MLHLDPAYPPVWRSPTALQFGAEAIAVIHDVQPWQERLLAELAVGIPEHALEPVAIALGGTPQRAHGLVAQVHAALRGEDSPAPTLRVAVRLPTGFSEDVSMAVIDTLAAAGALVEVQPERPDLPPRTPPETTVVMLSEHVADPELARALMHDDIPHLPIVFASRRVVVGPLVRPGETACLMCVEAARTDRDPFWPVVASQLNGRRVPPVSRTLATEAALLAVRMLTGPFEAVEHSVTLRADSSRRSWRAHPPHPTCRCRSLSETARDLAPAIADPPPDRATTTATT